MRFKELKYGDKIYTKNHEIIDILNKEKMFWLIDSEIENASIEIIKHTLIWNDGQYYNGNWKYGIFRNGVFNGIWEDGILEGGNFKGKWIDGIR